MLILELRLAFFHQVIAAEGEQKASRALREAANVIAESSSALQVRDKKTWAEAWAYFFEIQVILIPKSLFPITREISAGSLSKKLTTLRPSLR